MARIRYLKPGFFKDEDLSELPYEIRLLFSGLWIIADREGRLEDRSKRIKVEVFPYDDVDIEDGLVRLSKPKKISKKPFILRYVGKDGMPYIQILEWNKHQKPHHTERPSVIPPPTKEQLKNCYLTVKEQEGMGMGMGMGMENGDGEIKNTPYWAAFKESTQDLLKTVSKDFNIYALMGRLKKTKGIELPEDVAIRICESFSKNGSGIKDHWAWFIVTTKNVWETWNADQRVKEGQQWKEFKPPQEIMALIKKICR